jgi:hypothetical protein
LCIKEVFDDYIAPIKEAVKSIKSRENNNAGLVGYPIDTVVPLFHSLGYQLVELDELTAVEIYNDDYISKVFVTDAGITFHFAEDDLDPNNADKPGCQYEISHEQLFDLIS